MNKESQLGWSRARDQHYDYDDHDIILEGNIPNSLFCSTLNETSGSFVPPSFIVVESSNFIEGVTGVPPLVHLNEMAGEHSSKPEGFM